MLKEYMEKLYRVGYRGKADMVRKYLDGTYVPTRMVHVSSGVNAIVLFDYYVELHIRNPFTRVKDIIDEHPIQKIMLYTRKWYPEFDRVPLVLTDQFKDKPNAISLTKPPTRNEEEMLVYAGYLDRLGRKEWAKHIRDYYAQKAEPIDEEKHYKNLVLSRRVGDRYTVAKIDKRTKRVNVILAENPLEKVYENTSSS